MVLFYRDQASRQIVGKNGLPVISRDLDSVRAYQFEVEFKGKTADRMFRLAAKQVGPTGFTVDDIAVNRVNDQVFYPGKPSPEEIVITFDNLLRDDVSRELWNWFKGTYNPLTGTLGGADNKIDRMTIFQLNHDLSLHSSTQLIGVYPKGFKNAEFNYSTNEFHTIEVTFRYDFMDQLPKS